MQRNISFINRMNKSGPRIEPWGTPDLTGRASGATPPITTFCVVCAVLEIGPIES